MRLASGRLAQSTISAHTAHAGATALADPEVTSTPAAPAAACGGVKHITMINNDTLPVPVLFAVGALVLHARLMEGDVALSYADRPFNHREAAADPFGVGSVTPTDVQDAMYDAIQSRLDDHPSEWVNFVYADVIHGVLKYTEGETSEAGAGHPQTLHAKYPAGSCAARTGESRTPGVA